MTTRKSKAFTGKKRGPAGKRLAGPPSTRSKKKTVALQLPRVTAAEVKAAKKKFQQGILARGEAVEAGQPLTPGATHVIVGKSPDGTPILKRKRFSIS